MRFDAGKQFKIVEDSNGFITAEGVIASAGEKLHYKDGTETVAESALFKNMDEWEGLPLTLTHPRDLLIPETAQKHQVGSVIKAWRKDDQLWAKFKVTSKKALDAVRGGMRGLSAGYLVNMDNAKNQVKRFNNHLALCSVGRSASSGIRADERRDSFDINQKVTTMYEIKFPNGAKVKLDCSEAENQLLQGGIDSMQAKFDADEKEGKSKLEAMKAELEQAKKDGKDTDKLQASYDALVAKNKESKGKMDSDDLAIIFDTHEKAQKLDAKITIRNDDGSIKSARDLANEALSDVKMDGKSDDYAFARLDSTIEFAGGKNVQKQRGNGERTDSASTLTVQQKADSAFYTQEKK